MKTLAGIQVGVCAKEVVEIAELACEEGGHSFAWTIWEQQSKSTP
jgi:hypothetical protein